MRITKYRKHLLFGFLFAFLISCTEKAFSQEVSSNFDLPSMRCEVISNQPSDLVELEMRKCERRVLEGFSPLQEEIEKEPFNIPDCNLPNLEYFLKKIREDREPSLS